MQFLNFILPIAKDKEIVIYILFNQLSPTHKEFFNNSFNKANTKNVEITFIYDLPLHYYKENECPLCSNKRFLEQMNEPQNGLLRHEFMTEFYTIETKDLKILERNEVKYNNTVLDSRMFLFSVLFKKAFSDTKFRFLLWEELYFIKENIDNEIKKEDSALYALIHFLAKEPAWLKKPPLEFRNFREMISEFSKEVVQKELGFLENGDMEKEFRYKKAAVTVLRVSHKNKFIENIFIIFNNLHKEKEEKSEQLSLDEEAKNRVLPNLFFHTYSIIGRKYYKDEDKLKEMKSNLEKIHNALRHGEGEENMEKAIQFLIDEIRLKINEEKTDLEKIKELKESINKFLKESHSEVKLRFRRLQISEFSPEMKTDLSLSKKKEINEQIWQEVSYFFSSFFKLLRSLKHLNESYCFKKFFSNVKEYLECYTIGCKDPFMERMKALTLEKGQAEYHCEYLKLHNFLFSEKSYVQTFSEEFPANIFTITQKFLKNEKALYPYKFDVSQIDKNTDVYFPASSFSWILDLLSHNIKKHKRLSEGKEIDVEITVNKNKDGDFILVFKNTGSDENIDKKTNNIEGGLVDIKETLNHFGSQLIEHQQYKDYYKVVILFKKYD